VINLEVKNMHSRMVNAPIKGSLEQSFDRASGDKDPEDFSSASGNLPTTSQELQMTRA
jgi:hypothetical protein